MVLIIRPGWAASWFPRKYREIQSNQQHLTMLYANVTTILLFKVWNRPFSTISPRSSGYSCLWTDVLDHADNGEGQILILSISTYLVLSSHSNVQCFFRENPEFCFIFWNKLPVYCVECSVNLLIKCWEKWRRITRLSNVWNLLPTGRRRDIYTLKLYRVCTFTSVKNLNTFRKFHL